MKNNQKAENEKICGVLWLGGRAADFFWPTKRQPGILSLDFVAKHLKATGFELVCIDVVYVSGTDVDKVKCSQYMEVDNQRLWANMVIGPGHPDYARHYAENNIFFTGVPSEEVPILKAMRVSEMLAIMKAAASNNEYSSTIKELFNEVVKELEKHND